MKLILKAEFPLIIASGIVGQKIASKLWTAAFDSAPPDTAQKNVRWAMLIPAAVLEGTLYKLARMGLDRGLRVAVARSEGTWIGKTGEGE